MRCRVVDAVRLSTALAIVFYSASVAQAADAPSVKLALSFRPVQQDVEIETPPASEHGCGH